MNLFFVVEAWLDESHFGYFGRHLKSVKDEKLQKYKHMWLSGASGEWVILKGRTGVGLPYNLTTRLATVIEDDELSCSVVEAMLQAGIRILDQPPEPLKP